MLELKTKLLEVRGLQDCTSKKGNLYYNLNCEDVETGEAYKFYVNDGSLFPNNMKKGSKVILTLVYNSFKELRVTKIQLGE